MKIIKIIIYMLPEPSFWRYFIFEDEEEEEEEDEDEYVKRMGPL